MKTSEMLDWNPAHALVIHHPNGDHFFPQWASDVMKQWATIEKELGQTAWLQIASRRAREGKNWN